MMMKTFDESVKNNHNPNWLNISNYPYRILIAGGSGSGKTKLLLNLVKYHWLDIGKNYL